MNKRKILLFCCTGFVIQAYLLILDFAKFQTLVNVDHDISKYKTLPAITICLPKILSIKRVFEYFQRDNSSSEQRENVTKAYELYQAAILNFSLIETNKTRKMFMNSIYEDNFDSLIPNLTIMQIYEMSIPMSDGRTIYVVGKKLNEDGSTTHIEHEAH